EQWLVHELKRVNPRYFECSGGLWTIPEPGMFTLYGESLSLDEQHIARFTELWFPRGDCKQFLSLVAMADLYMPLFKKKAEQLRLHPDVAFLPVVLSGCNQQFNMNGRAGLWALSEPTASRHNLRVDTLVDERLGGDFTTDAALKYVASLAAGFSNDWIRASLSFKCEPHELAALDTSLHGEKLMSVIRPDVADFLKFHAYTLQLLRSVRGENQLSNCFDILGNFEPIIIEKPMQIAVIAEVLETDEARIRAANPVYTGIYIVPGYRRVPFVLENTLVGRFQAKKEAIANRK
ncbi:MAG: hypothetical protein ACKOZM_09665, partial [Flavobacteriales bacterium]